MSEELIKHDRLSDLEGAVRDISFKTGAIEARQEHLLTKVEEGFAGLQTGHKTIIDEQKALDTRLKPFEDSRAARAKRWDIAKKGIIPAIAAMAGLFGAKFGGVIWDAITKLF